MDIDTDVPRQGTPEWLQERLGFVTGSRFADVLAKARNKSEPWGQTAVSYALTLAGERLTGMPSQTERFPATDWGNEQEPYAVAAYEQMQGVTVETAGFVPHALVDWVGCSPDGLVGDDGTIEAKCPFTEREHLRTVWTGCMPDEHKAQVQGGLWVTGRQWCDFISYNPRLPESCSLFVSRVERDPEYIAKLSQRIEAFAGLVSEMVEVFSGNQ